MVKLAQHQDIPSPLQPSAFSLQPFLSLLAPLAGLGVALGAAALALKLSGTPPLAATRYALSRGLGSSLGVANVLHEASQLMFPALAVAFGFQAGLFNIGAEGQLYMASFAVAAAALALEGWAPGMAFPLLFLAAAGAGAAWALLPGLLKAYRGAHEVIATIMLNFVAFATVNIFMRPGSPLILEGTAQTKPIPEGFRLPLFADWQGWESLEGSRLNGAILIAAAALIWYWFFLWRTRSGLAFRAVGANPKAAEAAGIEPKRRIVAAMAISGALAGLLALDEVLGQRGSFGEDSAKGLGYAAIAVALLGRGHPLGILAAALFFGFLNHAGLLLQIGFRDADGIKRQAPREIVDAIQALVILAAAASPAMAERVRLTLAKKRLRGG
jgi:ABC-type uncharacterized transport system permease subunit